MGQARNRGTFAERQAQAIARNQEEERRRQEEKARTEKERREAAARRAAATPTTEQQPIQARRYGSHTLLLVAALAGIGTIAHTTKDP